MAIDYGVDTSILSGKNRNQLDFTFNLIPDPVDVILESVYKRVTTRQGIVDPPTGVFWDTNTLNLRDYLLASLSPQDIYSLKAQIEAIFYPELRYSVEATVNFSGRVLTVLLDITLSDNPSPIRMVLTVDSNQVFYERVS